MRMERCCLVTSWTQMKAIGEVNMEEVWMPQRQRRLAPMQQASGPEPAGSYCLLGGRWVIWTWVAPVGG